MIANISSPFSDASMKFKIDYQIGKIEEKKAKIIYNSVGDKIEEIFDSMKLLATLNDRIKNPYIEFVLSSPPGENLSDEKWLEVSKDYLQKMGYENSYFTIIRHNDKSTEHIHIYATTMDLDGIKIPDGYSRMRSSSIMRTLEGKYRLIPLKLNKNQNIPLKEELHRQYYFDSAVKKALRSYATKKKIESILKRNNLFKVIDLKKSYNYEEWRVILGDDFDEVYKILQEYSFFKTLYKEELCAILNDIELEGKNISEFKEKLKQHNVYMRLISKGEKSYYIYGLPEKGFYIKDTSLPQRFRYGSLKFDAGMRMSVSEQKHLLYMILFKTLSQAESYDAYKYILQKKGVNIIEHINKNGIYGLSYSLSIKDSIIFKSSDISRKLSFSSLKIFFGEKNKDQSVENIVSIYRKDEKIEQEIKWMQGIGFYPYRNDKEKMHRNDDLFISGKKKKFIKKKKKTGEMGL